MEFVVGCGLMVQKTLQDLHNYHKTLGLQYVSVGDLGVEEEYWVKKDPSHLIIRSDGNEVVGHAIWHETTLQDFLSINPSSIR